MNIEKELDRFKHKTKLNVRFSDLDAMGHVNNAKYLSYLEEARIAYFHDVLNFPQNSLAFGALVANVNISYLAPIEMGDEIFIYTRVSRIGNKSIEIENIFERSREGLLTIAARAVTLLVSFDLSTKSTVPISKNLKDKICKYENLEC